MASILLDGSGVAEAAEAIRRNTVPLLTQKGTFSSTAEPACNAVGQRLNDLNRLNSIVRRTRSNQDDALVNLVYGIVLWDKIYVLEERFNSHWHESYDFLRQYGVPVRILRIGGEKIYPRQYTKMTEEIYCNCFNDAIDLINQPDSLLSKYHHGPKLKKVGPVGLPVPVDRAISYWITAYSYGINYLPSVERQQILSELGRCNFNRIDIINKVDNELNDFYTELNNRIGRKQITFQIPVLLDYLMGQCLGAEDILGAAVELKNERHAVMFRAEMDGLEAAFDAGDFVAVNDYLRAVESISAKFTKAVPTTQTISLGISVQPYVEIPIDLDFRYFRIKRQLLFLKDLIQYGTRHKHSTYE